MPRAPLETVHNMEAVCATLRVISEQFLHSAHMFVTSSSRDIRPGKKKGDIFASHACFLAMLLAKCTKAD